jgi:hypothetical protein
MTVCQKVPKSYFQSQLSMSKIDRMFQIFFSFKNINIKHYFLASIFEPLYFLKSFPIFDELSFIDGISYLYFPLSMLILGQKSCFLGPTIFEIPQQSNCSSNRLIWSVTKVISVKMWHHRRSTVIILQHIAIIATFVMAVQSLIFPYETINWSRHPPYHRLRTPSKGFFPTYPKCFGW